MEYIYAAMLLHKAGKEVTEDAVKKVLEAAGVKAEDGRVKALVATLSGVDMDKAISEASANLSASAAPVSAPADATPKKEEKKDEGKSEAQAAAGLGALFG